MVYGCQATDNLYCPVMGDSSHVPYRWDPGKRLFGKILH